MLKFVLTLVLLSQLTEGANILFFNGLGEGSHFTVAAEIAKELVERNHSVIFLISNAYTDRMADASLSNLFEFEVFEHSLSLDRVRNRLSGWTEAAFEDRLFAYQMTNMDKIVKEINQDCSDLFENRALINKLISRNIDLTVYDPVWPCSAILADVIGVPHVALAPTSFLAAHCRLFGGETNSAYTPELGSGLPMRMSFVQRLQNTAWSLFNDAMVHFVIDSSMKALDAIPECQRKKGVKKIMKETSLWIINSDPIIDLPVALMPNMVVVSGMSTRPAGPLEKDLESFVRSSGDHGIIVFSLGGYVTHLPKEKEVMFLEVFGQLKQKIIWQWKGENVPVNMPENVRTMKWIPQNDLLGHNKTRLFIYQGGNNGLYEAIYHAVPLLVLPLIGDQPDVAQRVHERGIGKRLNPVEMTTESLAEAIRDILENPIFKTNVTYLSRMFHDRPFTPRETAAYHVEHLLRFGNEHLRSPVHDLSFVELKMLDVYAVLVGIVLLFIYMTYRVARYVISTVYIITVCRRKPKKD